MTGNCKPKSEHNEDQGLVMHFTMFYFQDINSPSELIKFIDIPACCIRMGHSEHFLESNKYINLCAQVLVALAMKRE